MKIAVTISNCVQVGIDQWRDVNRTKIFDSADSVDSMIRWAQTINPVHDFDSLKMSVVIKEEGKA